MTDNEIIKALEWCADTKGEMSNECPYVLGVCSCNNEQLHKDALDLINRQKAKIEALQMDNEQLQSDVANANMNLEHMTAEVERTSQFMARRSRFCGL